MARPARSIFTIRGGRKEITQGGQVRQWEEFLLSLRSLDPLAAGGGEGLYILTEISTSLALDPQMKAVLAKYPHVQWHAYDAAGAHSARTAATMSSRQHLLPA